MWWRMNFLLTLRDRFLFLHNQESSNVTRPTPFTSASTENKMRGNWVRHVRTNIISPMTMKQEGGSVGWTCSRQRRGPSLPRKAHDTIREFMTEWWRSEMIGPFYQNRAWTAVIRPKAQSTRERILTHWKIWMMFEIAASVKHIKILI